MEPVIPRTRRAPIAAAVLGVCLLAVEGSTWAGDSRDGLVPRWAFDETSGPVPRWAFDETSGPVARWAFDETSGLVARWAFDETSGLVARWAFDETSGLVARDACGRSAGTLRGDPPAFRLGDEFGRPLCFFLPGQQVTGPDKGFPVGAEPGTISLWFCRPGGVSNKVLFCYGARQRGCARGLWLVAADRLCFYFWGDPQDLYAAVPGGIEANRWHFVAGVYDGKAAKLYYDGRLIGQVAKTLHTKTGGAFHVGANLVENDGRDYHGMLDDVTVSARAWSAEEIAAEHRRGAARFAGYAGRDVAAYRAESRRRAARRRMGREKLLERARSLLLAAGVRRVVFAVRKVDPDGHWYANFGTNVVDPARKYYYDGGRLSVLDVASGEVTDLIGDPAGGVRDPQVHYDGRRIVLSYRKGGQPHYHLYEIDVESRRLRPLTHGPFDDLEPTWLPGGGIAFVSSRCRRWVPCYFTQVAVLYRCDADGRNIRRLSANVEHENTPWPLPDGRILYQRWEYIDRSQVGYHHLWTMNPDGTGQMVYFGNQHPNTVMIDAKPVPPRPGAGKAAGGKIVACFSPGHGRNEHSGVVTLVDPSGGPDARGLARPIAKGHFRDPYPLSEDLFLVVDGTDSRKRGAGCELSVMTAKGEVLPLHALPPADVQEGLKLHEPRPLRPRPREAVLPSDLRPARPTGTVLLEDVRAGRNMAGVRPGEIKTLLVLETLPKPYNIFSGMEPLSYGGTFLLARVLGTVPVEPDGSAFFELPALRAVSFAALDANGLAVKRMQSFLSVQPGESFSCVGCHERRVEAPAARRMLAAARRAPSRIRPVEGVPDVLDFPRDVQPILDRHCVACHDYRRTPRGGPISGGIVLAGDRGPMFSHSYYVLTIAGQFSAGRNLRRSNYPPRALGSAASELLVKVGMGPGRGKPTHHGVTLRRREQTVLRLWIDTGAAYPGTYAAMGTGSIGDYASGRLDRSDLTWPAIQTGREVIRRRCGTCHAGDRRLPDSPSDNRGLVPWNEGRMNALATGTSQRLHPAFRFNRHLVYNLTRPERSLLLLAPLAKSAGGYGTCKRGWDADSPPGPPFASTDDADYRRLLAAVREAAAYLSRIKRFDMPGFRPRAEYVREMKRFGVLAADLKPDHDPIDVYATDRAYWGSQR